MRTIVFPVVTRTGSLQLEPGDVSDDGWLLPLDSLDAPYMLPSGGTRNIYVADSIPSADYIITNFTAIYRGAI